MSEQLPQDFGSEQRANQPPAAEAGQAGVFTRIDRFMDRHPSSVYGVGALGVVGIIEGADQLNIGSAGADGHVPAARVKPAPEGFTTSLVKDEETAKVTLVIPHGVVTEAPESEPTAVRLSMPTVEAEAWPTATRVKVPETSDASASATQTLGKNALKELCVTEGLKKPIMPQNFLARLREKQVGYQQWGMAEGVWLLPSECNGKFKRFMWVQPEVQDPKHPKRWHAALRPKKHFVLASNRGALGDEYDPNSTKGDYNNRVDGSQMGLMVDLDSRAQAYQCAPGARKNSARVKLIQRIKKVATGKFVAGKVWKYKTRVIPPC